MSHGILFDTIHTFDTWGLILLDFSMSNPAPKRKYIDLPIGDGSIDLTEAIYGDISYSDRIAAFSFGTKCPEVDRSNLQSMISATLHGKKCKIMLPDDPYHYYIGRLTVSPIQRYGTIGLLQMEAICEPYKYKQNLTKVAGTIPAGGSVNLDVKNARMRVIPKITVSAAATISHAGNNYSVQAGTWRLTNIVLTEGSNILTITAAQGTTYTIEYQEGAI